MSSLDTQVGGSHYKDNAIQPLQYSMANGLGFCEANIIKYTTRYRHKGGLEDLKKVKHYIELHFDTVKTEPWIFTMTRMFLNSAKGRSTIGIQPSEYIVANGISNKNEMHLIAGVCFWRDMTQTAFTKASMLSAIMALIYETENPIKCPRCESREVVHVLFVPDGRNMNNGYDCRLCGYQWETEGRLAAIDGNRPVKRLQGVLEAKPEEKEQ